MNRNWLLVPSLVFASSCLEDGDYSFTCPETYTLLLKRGETVDLPWICSDGASPAGPEWPLARTELGIYGFGDAAPPPGIGFDSDMISKVTFRETAVADPMSRDYSLLIRVAPRRSECEEGTATCRDSEIALTIRVFDDLPFSAEIEGVPADGIVAMNVPVTLAAVAQEGSGSYAYAWEAWNVLELDMMGQPTRLSFANMDSRTLDVGLLSGDQYLFKVTVTDTQDRATISLAKLVQPRVGTLDIVGQSDSYPQSPLTLSCEVGAPVSRCSDWLLQRATNVPEAEIAAVALDPARLAAVAWETLETVPGGGSVEWSMRVSGQKQLFRASVAGRDNRDIVLGRSVRLIPRHY